MKDIAEKLEKLETDYSQLKCLITTLTYAMKYCEYESLNTIDLLYLQEYINVKSKLLDEKLEELTDEIYKKASIELSKQN